jgi:prepilin-type N-terminal cleavage/methylation domain-containing protein/prepilin-type processing-associated H-X9-DG protein
MVRTRVHPGGGRRAFTLVELLVVIGIIAILVTILMPALSRARNQAAKVNCMSQLRQLSLGVIQYANNWKGYMPATWGICDPPGPQTIPVDTGWLWKANVVQDKALWLCPADPRRGTDLQYSYTYNCRMMVNPGEEDVFPAPSAASSGPRLIGWDRPGRIVLRRIQSFKMGSDCILFAEENTVGRQVGDYKINDAYFVYFDVTDDRHMGKSVVSYLDGHAGDIPKKIMIWTNKEWGWCR